MEITNERLLELSDLSPYKSGVLKYVSNSEVESIAKELQSLRKIDMPGTLKYAEEAGAACEEIKYDIELVKKEIRSRKVLIVPDNKGKGVIVGLTLAEELIDKYLSKHLDLKMEKQNEDDER